MKNCNSKVSGIVDGVADDNSDSVIYSDIACVISLRELLQLRRPSRSLRSSNHNLLSIPRRCTAFVWNSLPHTITDDVNISAPDLKHSSTEGPISINNDSVTLTTPVIRLIGRHMPCF